MKQFVLGLVEYLTELVMCLPSRFIRIIWLKLLGLHCGKRVWIFRKVEIRRPYKLTIANNVKINSRVLLDCRGGKIFIGNNVDIAQDCRLWTLEHDPMSDFYETKGGGIQIDDYAWIASGATILPNVKIGKGAIVASGAVVTKDVPPMTIVAGIPAKKIGERKSKLLYEIGKVKPYFK